MRLGFTNLWKLPTWNHRKSNELYYYFRSLFLNYGMVLITYKLIKFSQLFFIYFYYYTFKFRKKSFEKIIRKNNNYSDKAFKKKFFFSTSLVPKLPTGRFSTELGSFRKIARIRHRACRKKWYSMKVEPRFIKKYSPIFKKPVAKKYELSVDFDKFRYKPKKFRKLKAIYLKKTKKISKTLSPK